MTKAKKAFSSPRLPCYGCHGNKSQYSILVTASALLRLLRQQKPRRHSCSRVCLAAVATATRAKTAYLPPLLPCYGVTSLYGILVPRICLAEVATATRAKMAFPSPRLLCHGDKSKESILVPASSLLRLLRSQATRWLLRSLLNFIYKNYT